MANLALRQCIWERLRLELVVEARQILQGTKHCIIAQQCRDSRGQTMSEPCTSTLNPETWSEYEHTRAMHAPW